MSNFGVVCAATFVGESGTDVPHSTTLRVRVSWPMYRQVFECGATAPLSGGLFPHRDQICEIGGVTKDETFGVQSGSPPNSWCRPIHGCLSRVSSLSSSMITKWRAFLAAALAMAMAPWATAGDVTAFDLIKEGNHYVSEQSKDKVVAIHSEKSVGSLTPNIWYVVYYDPDATLKAVQVKFGAGQKMDVSHPLRLLEPVTGADKVLDRSQLKVDSDQALKIAKSQPLLSNLTLRASQLWLLHGDIGPVWKVKLWAAKLNHPNDEADIGVVLISAADGTIVKTDLHPNSVD
jgi:hypothetical protein